MSPLKKSNLQPAWDAWWMPLTRQGDPARRYYLTEEAFVAGYEYAKREVLAQIAEEFKQRAGR